MVGAEKRPPVDALFEVRHEMIPDGRCFLSGKFPGPDLARQCRNQFDFGEIADENWTPATNDGLGAAHESSAGFSPEAERRTALFLKAAYAKNGTCIPY